MGNSTNFALFWGKLSAGMPAAVEAAEVLGGLLAPGKKTGPAKLAAVKQGLGIVAMAGQAAAPFLPAQLAAIDLAAVGVINAAVGLRAAFLSGQAPAAAAAPSTVETGPESDPPAAPGPRAAAAAAAPAPPVITDIKPGVREVNGVRQVWDQVNQAWDTPGR